MVLLAPDVTQLTLLNWFMLLALIVPIVLKVTVSPGFVPRDAVPCEPGALHGPPCEAGSSVTAVTV